MQFNPGTTIERERDRGVEQGRWMRGELVGGGDGNTFRTFDGSVCSCSWAYCLLTRSDGDRFARAAGTSPADPATDQLLLSPSSASTPQSFIPCSGSVTEYSLGARSSGEVLLPSSAPSAQSLSLSSPPLLCPRLVVSPPCSRPQVPQSAVMDSTSDEASRIGARRSQISASSPAALPLSPRASLDVGKV